MMYFEIVVCVLIFLLFCYLYLVMPSQRAKLHVFVMKDLYLAHRGLHDDEHGIPENSLAAFEVAVEQDFGFEFDVHLTKDGHCVVLHDSVPTRMCGKENTTPVEEMTLAEVRRLHLLDTAETIPLLQEVLAAANGQVPLLIELKCEIGHAAPLCQKANEILSQYGGVYFIESFCPTALLWYRRHQKKVCRGQLSCRFSWNRGHFWDSLAKKMLSSLLFNFLSRPDFIAYQHSDRQTWNRRFCTFWGATPVGWTFRREEEVTAALDDFTCYIFEGFLPKNAKPPKRIAKPDAPENGKKK